LVIDRASGSPVDLNCSSVRGRTNSLPDSSGSPSGQSDFSTLADESQDRRLALRDAPRFNAQLFNYAVRMRYLERSPVTGVERGRVEPCERRVLRPHELRALLEAADGEDRALLAVLIFAGLRRAETYRVQWDWIDFEAETLHVKKAKRAPGKIPLAPYLKRALMTLGTGLTGPVFVGRHRTNAAQAAATGPKAVTDMRRALARTFAAAGMDPTGIGFHTFRHSFISLIERLPGVSYSVVRALARHGHLHDGHHGPVPAPDPGRAAGGARPVGAGDPRHDQRDPPAAHRRVSGPRAAWNGGKMVETGGDSLA
jgi:site-specific recombinase XerD